MLFKIISTVYFTTVITALVPSLETKIVNTTSGPIKGKVTRWKNTFYYSYEGIPYAESPTGDLRFKPPVPKKPWTHVYDATHEGFVCPQNELKYKRQNMDEDCLFLNIYVPANTKKMDLPVLVFVHGGAFRILSGHTDLLYGPQFFLEHGIIFVTMNYRLGALGFLSLDIEDASGNAGIKDILLALQWISRNIERFSGNRNRITISGQSSGATLVHYLLLSKQSTGLFQQAILMSGSAICHRSITRHAKDTALLLVKELGLQTNDTQQLLKELKEFNVYDIIDAEVNMNKYDDIVLRPFSPFTPSIEIESSHAFITRHPLTILKSGLVQNIPILVGFNYQEGVYGITKIKRNEIQLKNMKENMELAIPSDIEYPLGSEVSKALANSISEFYFKDKILSNFTLNNILELITDSQYIYSTHSWINIHTRNNNSNTVYYYGFNFDGDLNWSKINYKINFPGTAHADELGYLFVTEATEPMLKNINFNSRIVLNIMTTLFSNFITYGNPVPKSFASNFKWPDYGKTNTILLINNHPTESKFSYPLDYRFNFWNAIYEQYWQYVENGGKLQKKCLP